MKVAGLLLGMCLLIVTTACVSTPLKFPTAPIGPNEKALGKSEATSTGIMLFAFIPINQNTRFENAMKEAAAKAGGTRLTDVTISEQWFWALILNGYIFKVEGTAVANK
ncbi:MAG: hypothetical protein C5B60_05420 [Chloroflexi bacterium]|nr:MAG: hypothetical protein C5B60_05420 [Chloroflexota bacterium]